MRGGMWNRLAWVAIGSVAGAGAAGLLAVAAFGLGLHPASAAQQATSAKTASEKATEERAVPLAVSAQAHKVLAEGLAKTGLGGEGVPAFHLKAEWQLLPNGPQPGATKPNSGALEVWSAGPHQWRRTYTSSAADENGTEWSVGPTERYATKRVDGFARDVLNLRIGRPVLDPLYQASKIPAYYDMDLRQANLGVMLDCIWVPHPSLYTEDTDPDLLYPTMCFDQAGRLRLSSSADTVVRLNEYQPFGDRMVARHIQVLVKSNLVADIKVTVLEPLAAGDEAKTKPGKDAARLPYEREPGDPPLVATYQVGGSIGILDDHTRFFGSVGVPVLIEKDGSVRLVKDRAPRIDWDSSIARPCWSCATQIADGVEMAVKKWKYRPYLVDGQPVEVAATLDYPEEYGKPFVPEYERAKSMPAKPEDFSSAFSPSRDPATDLASAEAEAKAQRKLILMEVGGDWSLRCKALDAFLAKNRDLLAARDRTYILLRVNMGPGNENRAFLSQYPKIATYPHWFVLDADGKVLASKEAAEMENGKDGYDAKLVGDFLGAWGSSGP